MSGIFLPVFLAVGGVLLAMMTYRGIRRGGARYYTLEREAILRRASLLLLFSVILFLASVGLLVYQRQQLTAVEEPAVVEGEGGESGGTLPQGNATPSPTFSVEQFPPTETPTPVNTDPTPTATPLVCRAIVEGTSGNGLTLRTVPGGDEISVLPDGSVLTVLDDPPQEVNGFTWLKVRVVGGEEGWVAEDFLTIRAPCGLEE